MTVKELFEYVKEFKDEFKEFKSNDFTHLEEKVDKISTKVAWVVGIVSGLGIAINILIRVMQ
jgi:hypothetical protein